MNTMTVSLGGQAIMAVLSTWGATAFRPIHARMSGTFALADAFLVPLHPLLTLWIPFVVGCIAFSDVKKVFYSAPPAIMQEGHFGADNPKGPCKPVLVKEYDLTSISTPGGKITVLEPAPPQVHRTHVVGPSGDSPGRATDELKEMFVASARSSWLAHAGAIPPSYGPSVPRFRWTVEAALGAAGKASGRYEVGLCLAILGASVRALVVGFVAARYSPTPVKIIVALYEFVTALGFVVSCMSSALGHVRKYLGVALEGTVYHDRSGARYEYQTALLENEIGKTEEGELFHRARTTANRGLAPSFGRLLSLSPIRPLTYLTWLTPPDTKAYSTPRAPLNPDDPQRLGQLPLDETYKMYHIKVGPNKVAELEMPVQIAEILTTYDNMSDILRKRLKVAVCILTILSCGSCYVIGPSMFALGSVSWVDFFVGASGFVTAFASWCLSDVAMLNSPPPWLVFPQASLASVEAGRSIGPQPALAGSGSPAQDVQSQRSRCA